MGRPLSSSGLLVISKYHLAQPRLNWFYYIPQEAYEFKSLPIGYVPPFITTPRRETCLQWDQCSGWRKILYAVYQPLKRAYYPINVWLNKSHPTQENVLTKFWWNETQSFFQRHYRFFGYFLRIMGISPWPQRQSFYSECIPFWCVS